MASSKKPIYVKLRYFSGVLDLAALIRKFSDSTRGFSETFSDTLI